MATVVIPYDQLESHTLDAMIKDYILREGTDYGLEERSLESKIKQVRRQIEKGEAVISYDTSLKSCNITVKGSLNG